MAEPGTDPEAAETTKPDGKPKKKWRKTKRIFFLACMGVAGFVGYLIGEDSGQRQAKARH